MWCRLQSYPRTGKSISIALAFALRACVRASEAASARRFSSGWGSAREFVGRRRRRRRRPSVRPGSHLDEKFAQ